MNFETFLSKYQKVPVTLFPYEAAPEPRVSVCVQTYKHAAFIAKCLDGIIMQQTNFPFDVWVGEDDSDDGTRDICIRYAQQHPQKIRLVLHHRVNNIAIDGKPSGRFSYMYNMYSGKGKYLAICEGDDYWTDPQKLQKQYDYLEQHPETVLCYHPWRNVNVRFDPPRISGPATSIRTCTLMFRHVFADMPETTTLAPNGDTFFKYLLKPRGRFALLTDIEPAGRCIHGANIMGAMSNYQKLSRRIRTMEVVLQTLAGTPEAKVVAEKLTAFRLQHALLAAYHEPAKKRPGHLMRALSLMLRHPRPRQTMAWVKEAWKMKDKR